MKIKLNEIPQEGRDYTFDRESGELNEALADLIGEHGYDVKLFIKPIGSAYEMTGRLKSTVTEICSRCGWDLEIPLERKVHEILLEEGDEDRKGHSVHGNRSVDFSADGPNMTPVKGDVFDAAEFVHETIALAEPLYPSCGNDNCEHLAEVEAKKRELELEFAGAEVQKTSGHPAFSALKDLKIEGKGGSKGSKRH